MMKPDNEQRIYALAMRFGSDELKNAIYTIGMDGLASTPRPTRVSTWTNGAIIYFASEEDLNKHTEHAQKMVDTWLILMMQGVVQPDFKMPYQGGVHALACPTKLIYVAIARLVENVVASITRLLTPPDKRIPYNRSVANTTQYTPLTEAERKTIIAACVDFLEQYLNALDEHHNDDTRRQPEPYTDIINFGAGSANLEDPAVLDRRRHLMVENFATAYKQAAISDPKLVEIETILFCLDQEMSYVSGMNPYNVDHFDATNYLHDSYEACVVSTQYLRPAYKCLIYDPHEYKRRSENAEGPDDNGNDLPF